MTEDGDMEAITTQIPEAGSIVKVRRMGSKQVHTYEVVRQSIATGYMVGRRITKNAQGTIYGRERTFDLRDVVA